MGLFTDIAQLFNQGYGWIFVLLLVAYELYTPKLLDQDTALAPLVRDLPEKVDDVADEQTEIRRDVDHVQEHVEEVQERQKVQMQVQRAQARANDEMDESKVDDYLMRNGVSVDSFLNGEGDNG